MDIIHSELELPFRTKNDAVEFIRKMKQEVYKYDVITVLDVFRHHGLPLNGTAFDYGYDKKMIKKLKAEKQDNGGWLVKFPIPGKLIRDQNGYWTTENVQPVEKTDQGGG